MKIFSLVFTSVLLFSQISLAAPTCKFKPLNGGTSGVCSDDEFTVALLEGNVASAEAMIEANPNYLYSCNYSHKFNGTSGTNELMNPLIYTVCHTVYGGMKDMVVMLLNHIDKEELLCATPDRRMTVKDCVNRISDEQVRDEVSKVLEL
ncbi:hypothetical protein [Bdellovibrio sp. HCB337]|uniref:hypothetical protein n=1 Tax=Bdellovibrio sp. HCB337 TaxID=3394358 RepID=UPI0039A59EAE